MAAFATRFCLRHCVFLCKGTKLQNSAKPNSGDSLPVFALECFSANETGVLGLWLEGFGKSGLFMCQSQSSRPTLLPPLQPWFVKETAFFSAKAQKLKNSAKPNSRTICRFPPWYAFLPLIPAVWGFGLGLLVRQGF